MIIFPVCLLIHEPELSTFSLYVAYPSMFDGGLQGHGVEPPVVRSGPLTHPTKETSIINPFNIEWTLPSIVLGRLKSSVEVKAFKTSSSEL